MLSNIRIQKSYHNRSRKHRRSIGNIEIKNSPFVLPSLQRLQQLNNLIPLPQSHIVDANTPHLDIIIQQKIEEPKQPVKFIVMCVNRERRVEYRRRRWSAPDRLCDT